MTIFDDIKRRVTLADLLGTTEKRIRCPVHQDNHPSCDLDHDLNLWHCKACDAGGDVFSLLEQRDGLSRAEALKELANRAGVALTPQAQADAEQARTLEEQIQAQRWAMVRHYQETLFQHQQALGTLMGRGFSEKTLREMHVGYADASNRFEGNSYFDSRFIFPMVIRGRVEQISGRLAPWNPSPQKYLHLKGVDVAHFYNQDAITDTIWVFEGHPDTLSGVEIGLPAVGVVGTSGMQHPERFKRCKQIYICPDNDPAGAKAAEKWVAAMLGAGVKADILLVSLPAGVKDFNEWFLANRGEGLQGAFDALRNGAKPPINWKIDRLTSAADLEGLWPYLQPLTETQREEPFRRVKDRLGIPGTTVRQEFSRWLKDRQAVAKAAPENFDLVDVSFELEEVKRLHCGFTFGADQSTAHVCIYGHTVRANKEGEQVKGVEPVLIKSTVKLGQAGYSPEKQLVGSPDELTGDPPHLGIIKSRGGAWSGRSVDRFLRGAAEVPKTGDIIRRIVAMTKKYVWHQNTADYDLMGFYALGTYAAWIFGVYPYLCFTGMKRSGKSNSMELMQHLCYNSLASISITPSVMFRLVESSGCTVFFDEAQSFNKIDEHNQEAFQIALSGYKLGSGAWRNQAVKRDGVQDYESRDFEVFSPKIFGGMGLSNQTLLDRSIIIESLRCSQETAATILDMAKTRAEWERECAEIRDLIYVWLLTQFDRIHKNYVQSPSFDGLYNREGELWTPLLTLAYMADEDDGFPQDSFLVRLQALALEKGEEKNGFGQSDENTRRILDAILELIQTGDLKPMPGHPEWYPLGSTAKKVTGKIREDARLAFDITPNRLGRMLREAQAIPSGKEGKRNIKLYEGKKTTLCVYLCEDALLRSLEALS
jgi:DNA primase